MAVSVTTDFNRFSTNPALEGKLAAHGSQGLLAALWHAFEIAGRKRAMTYFAQKSDGELAQLGLTRSLIAERLAD